MDSSKDRSNANGRQGGSGVKGFPAMSNDFETRLKHVVEKARPLIGTVIADLEREANLIRERDLDPRKLAEEPKIQEARNASIAALEQLTAFAKSLDSLAKQYASDVEKKIDVDALKEQLATAPAAARARIGESQERSHDVSERIKATGEDARSRLEASAHERREKVDEAAQKGKHQLSAAAHKSKESTTEMLAALGWAAAAGAVIYIVFMDEKRRSQARSFARMTCGGLLSIIGSVTKRS